jgi:hypothetical protein
MRPLPIRDHPVADIPRVAKRLGPTRPAIRAATTALRPVAGKVVRAGAWVPGRQIGGDAFPDDRVPDLALRPRLGCERRWRGI